MKVTELLVFTQRKHGDAKGGPYMAAHLRRADFLHARPNDVPSLEHTANQLKAVLDKQKLKTIFIATDAPKEGRPMCFLLLVWGPECAAVGMMYGTGLAVCYYLVAKIISYTKRVRYAGVHFKKQGSKPQVEPV